MKATLAGRRVHLACRRAYLAVRRAHPVCRLAARLQLSFMFPR